MYLHRSSCLWFVYAHAGVMRRQRSERWLDRMQSSGLPDLLICSDQMWSALALRILESWISVPMGCSYSWLKPVVGFLKVGRSCHVKGEEMVNHWCGPFSKPEPRRWGPQKFWCIAWCGYIYCFIEEESSPSTCMHVRLMCEVLIACVQPLACPSLWFPLTIACVSARKLSGSTFNLVLRHIPMLQHGGILQWEGSSQCSFQGGWIFSGKLRLFVQREGNGFSFPWGVWVSVSVFHCEVQQTSTGFKNSSYPEMHV